MYEGTADMSSDEPPSRTEMGGVCGGTGHCSSDGDMSTLLVMLLPPTLP